MWYLSQRSKVLFNFFNVLSHFEVVEKSKYIDIISNSFGAFQMYLYENCYKQERIFGESSNDSPQGSSENKKTN